MADSLHQFPAGFAAIRVIRVWFCFQSRVRHAPSVRYLILRKSSKTIADSISCRDGGVESYSSHRYGMFPFSHMCFQQTEDLEISPYPFFQGNELFERDGLCDSNRNTAVTLRVIMILISSPCSS